MFDRDSSPTALNDCLGLCEILRATALNDGLGLCEILRQAEQSGFLYGIHAG